MTSPNPPPTPWMKLDEGRIPKAVFIATTSAFLAVCVITSSIRCYIRFRIQKIVRWDDAFLIFGLCSLATAIALLFTVIDMLYETRARIFADVESIALLAAKNKPKFIEQEFHFKNVSSAAVTLAWLSMCSAKFCFLAFFKSLIRQMPTLTRYWWFTAAFNIFLTAYGVLSLFLACPYFKYREIVNARKCTPVDLSLSNMVLDIISDIFILVIPIVLVWQIRVSWGRKVALTSTLCLTVITILITIARIAGVRHKGKLDFVWTAYFHIIGAEVGLTLVSISAFRTLYISKTKSRRNNETPRSFGWYGRGIIDAGKFIGMTAGKILFNSSDDKKNGDILDHGIPHGTLTGMRTIIDHNGKTDTEMETEYSP